MKLTNSNASPPFRWDTGLLLFTSSPSSLHYEADQDPDMDLLAQLQSVSRALSYPIFLPMRYKYTLRL